MSIRLGGGGGKDCGMEVEGLGKSMLSWPYTVRISANSEEPINQLLSKEPTLTTVDQTVTLASQLKALFG